MSEQTAEACPINPVVDLIFSRWTTPILWVLRHHGRQRFNELHGRLPSITAKVLTQRLRRLERDGLLTRTYHAEIPPRVEYEISELGLTLSTVFATLVSWSDAHLPAVEDARRQYDADHDLGTHL
ncbi:winged helix-turn-helix transcriptional regulator [Streptosporangium sp. CA-135522]|uniref:winged helix-turn-helix transcriptional regulator n=1 Tax=Streptosporangium sp. CA-135522 TaxID=3240072 RepID=UPI003D94E086